VGRGSGGRLLAVAVAALAVTFVLCARQAGAVAHGQDAPPGAFPFNAKLTSNDIPVAGGGVRFGACTGALVARKWVITAGHCFHDINRVPVGGPPPYHMTVTIGRTDDSDIGGHVAHVINVAQSPVNDVALAELDVPVDDITPIRLPARAPAAGDQLEIAGWGATSTATPVVPSKHLQLGWFSISSVDATHAYVRGVAPQADTSACDDDSGAPYFVPDGARLGTLVAVENTGPNCPHTSAETTARIDVITGWIDRQLTTTKP
jgi:secreted trypsin-like serine protease